MLKHSNPKMDFYKYVKSKLKNKNDIISMRTPTGGQTTNKQEISVLFANFFGSVYRSPTGPPHSVVEPVVPPDQQLNEFSASADQILLELQRLPSKETNTPDGVPPIVYKKCAYTLMEPVNYIVSLSLKKGIIPDK
jgi:hypothetical protein